ncbi:MAG: RES family NAD+ phosphorylase [Tabrizicola sp.]|nr:RES family NAD+ phosphorylase [Tabrizicola sp.]
MRVWRLARPEFGTGLDGEGSRLWGGTWNSPGVPVVYLASSLALATLEVLVNLPASRRSPGNFPSLLAVALDLDSGDLVDPGIPAGLDTGISRETGDAWLASSSSLALFVPSRVIPLERNVLMNPRHPAIASVTVALAEPFVFVDRLGY